MARTTKSPAKKATKKVAKRANVAAPLTLAQKHDNLMNQVVSQQNAITALSSHISSLREEREANLRIAVAATEKPTIIHERNDQGLHRIVMILGAATDASPWVPKTELAVLGDYIATTESFPAALAAGVFEINAASHVGL